MTSITITGTWSNPDGTYPTGKSITAKLRSQLFLSGGAQISQTEFSAAINESTGAFSLTLAVPDDSAEAALYRFYLPDNQEFNASVSQGSSTSWATFVANAVVADTYEASSLLATAADLTSHTSDTSNPHSVTAAQAGALAIANNLSDLNNSGTARTNLGLGTMAVEDDAPSDGTQYARQDGAWASVATFTDATSVVYVSKEGDDANDGLTLYAPKLTIGAGITAAAALITGGATAAVVQVIDAGTYTENLTITAGVSVNAPFATLVGTATLAASTMLSLHTHYTAANGQVALEKSGGTGRATYLTRVLDTRGTAGTLTGCDGIKNASNGSVLFAFMDVLYVSESGEGVTDGGAGFGHIHFWAPDLYLAGDNAVGINAATPNSDFIGYIDHILEIGTPATTTGIVVSNAGAVVQATVTEIIADTAYNVSAGSLYLQCPKITGSVVGTITHDQLTPLVTGPASSTDNAIARFDTTTGKLLQNSAATVDDSGGIALAAASTLTVTDAVTATVTDLFTLRHNTSGTSANGFGAGAVFDLDGTTAARISGVWSNKASDRSAVEISTRYGGAPNVRGKFTDVGFEVYNQSGTLTFRVDSAFYTPLPLVTTAAGTAGAPAINIGGDADTGWYQPAAGRWHFSANGADIARFGIGIFELYKPVYIPITTANTATAEIHLYINGKTTGTPAAGFGAGLLFQLESSTTESRDAASIVASWTTATDATRAADIAFNVAYNGVLREMVTITSSDVTLRGGTGLTTAFTIGGAGIDWNSAYRTTYAGTTTTTALQLGDGTTVRANTGPIHYWSGTSRGWQFVSTGTVAWQWTGETMDLVTSKLNFAYTMGDSTLTVGTDAPADWVEIQIGGVTRYLPAYAAS